MTEPPEAEVLALAEAIRALSPREALAIAMMASVQLACITDKPLMVAFEELLEAARLTAKATGFELDPKEG